MLDFIILFGAAIIGGVVVIIGSTIILGQKITGPRKELQQKVKILEKEIEKLKDRK